MNDNFGSLVSQTEDLLKTVAQRLSKANTTTGITTGTGITYYDLEAQLKLFFPVITPLRNRIPRDVVSTGDTIAHFKRTTKLDPANTYAGVNEGIRGQVIQNEEEDVSVAFKTLGLENSLTEEAELAARGFDNALALMQSLLSYRSFIAEERMDLWGNANNAFGTPSAPTGTATGSGTVTSGSECKVAALTYDCYLRSSVANGVVVTFTFTPADGSQTYSVNGGVSAISAASAGVTTSSQGVKWSATAVPGAAAYAWYTSSDGTNFYLGGITTTNSFLQTANTSSSNQNATAVGASDHSTRTQDYDGLISWAVGNGTSQGGGYYTSLDGAALTSSGDGGVTQIDTALKSFWDNNRLSPTRMYVGAQEAKSITKLVVNNGSAPVYRFDQTAGAGQGTLVGSALVTSYLNKFALGGARDLPVEIHPDLPDGNIFFDCETPPYAISNVPSPRRIKAQRGWYSILWPQTTRTRFVGVYERAALEVYFNPCFGLIQNAGAA